MFSAIKLTIFFITAAFTIFYLHKKTDKLIPDDKFLLSIFLLIAAGIITGSVAIGFIELLVKFVALWNII